MNLRSNAFQDSKEQKPQKKAKRTLSEIAFGFSCNIHVLPVLFGGSRCVLALMMLTAVR